MIESLNCVTRQGPGPRILLLRLLLGATLSCAALAAPADIYKWVDAKGQTHYSDTPPDASVKSTPLTMAPAVGTTVAPQAGTTGTAPAAGPGGGNPADKAAPGAKPGKVVGSSKPEESDETRRLREDNCLRMRNEQAMMSQGLQLFSIDEKGQRSVIDNDTRAARVAELQNQISSNCN